MGTREGRVGVSVIVVMMGVMWVGEWAVGVGDCDCSGGNRVGEFGWG